MQLVFQKGGLAVLLLAFAIIVAACTGQEPTPIAEPIPTVVPTPEPTPTVAPTPEPNSPAAISISPMEDFNPIFTQHTFVIAVQEDDGSPSDGAKVELLLNRFPGSVGDIVEVRGVDPQKIDNGFAVVRTDADGQAFLTITATREGDTDVTAFAPEIADPDVHKEFAVKHWVDMLARLPEDGVNFIGTDHVFTVQVVRATSGEPIEGVEVRWGITDNSPAAQFAEATEPGQGFVNTTDASGQASATLRQISPERGENVVSIEVLGTGGVAMFAGEATKHWVSSVLDLVKEGPTAVGLGSEVAYQITVTNSGDSEANEVMISDQIPAGMSYVGSSPQAAVEGNMVAWNLGTLEPEASQGVELVLRANEIGTWTNTVVVASAEGVTDSAEATTQVVPGRLEVSKSGPEQINIGGQATYTIGVENSGEGELTGVRLTDAIPEGMSFISANPEGTVEGANIIWDLGILASGQGTSLTITLQGEQAGTWTNTVDATSAEDVMDSASATTEVVQPSLAIVKEGPSSVLVGEEFVYNIEVSNQGQGVATGITLVDTLPAGFELVDSAPAAQVDGSVLTWNLGNMEPGGSAAVQVTVRASEGGTYENTADVTSQEGISSQAVAVTQVLVASVDVEKTGPAGIFIDREGTYTLSVTNTGEVDLTEVVVTDNVPEGLEFLGATPGASLVDGNVVTWEVGSIGVGEVREISLTFRGSQVGPWTNLARVETLEGATAAHELPISVLSASGASLNLEDDPDPIAIGETADYMITVSNQSTHQAITNVQVRLEIPAQMSFVNSEGPTEGSHQDGVVSFGSIASIDPGESRVFTITVQAQQAADVLARALLSYAEFQQTVTTEEGTTIFQP